MQSRALLFLAILLVAAPAFARKTDFMESHKGLVFGAGIYMHPSANDNLFDPVPELAAAGTTIAGSKSGYLIPIKFGVFVEGGNKVIVELYGRYMMNTGSWTATGNFTGTGTTRFKSYGGGGSFSIISARTKKLRLLVTFNGEYMFEKADLTFPGAELSVKSPGLLAGIGLQPEVYIGDLYILSVFLGYQYGLSKVWSAAADGAIFGTNHSAGVITSPLTGGTIKSQFGGLLIEANLRLAFF
jgi:hypothetical protein